MNEVDKTNSKYWWLKIIKASNLLNILHAVLYLSEQCQQQGRHIQILAGPFDSLKPLPLLPP